MARNGGTLCKYFQEAQEPLPVPLPPQGQIGPPGASGASVEAITQVVESGTS